ncbi:MAG: ATP-dependent DNA helicase RecG [Crocinitomicaceae bacterium]|nr:ATP-dependent DNA helicase RecG [Crocinitomicaceae bacterium]
MSESLFTPIAYLKGIGPQKAELLKKELQIETYWDLLNHFPFRYVDRSKIQQCDQLHLVEGYIQLEGFIDQIQELGGGRAKRLQCRFTDDTGSIQLVWFQGWKWIKQTLILGKKYRVFGRPRLNGNFWSIAHPELAPTETASSIGYQPIYPSTEKLSAKGLHTRGLEHVIKGLLERISLENIPDRLPESLRKAMQLVGIDSAYRNIHQPTEEQGFIQAKKRFVFEELFLLQLEMILRKGVRKRSEKGFVFSKSGDNLANFYHNKLPFDLTEAQKRVVREIRKDMQTGQHMNRLLQGDVGSGKTLVALITMLIAQGNGFQSALLAPTEILSAQHYETIVSFLADLPIRCALLTGSVKRSQRKPLLESLANGEIDLLIGTHALLEDEVVFKNLGLVVIDEQHRFGVAQRAKMRKKNTMAPHVLVMTATPIPRTLAMTFYGDLDVSAIDELPPGRKPIQTIHRFDSHRLQLHGFMREQIAKGRQIYVVYPLIDESETLDFKSLSDGFEAISRAFPLPEYQVSIVHGKLKPEVKEYEMKRFVEGITNIMVATTVIEVGVNVPNATVMVIESAQRFGLSQLHQLRGRVGRGAEKSYCILMTNYELSKEAKKRMETMVETTDGFKIAEVDLSLRGPGDLLGTQQSGALNLKVADLSKDQHIVSIAREAATQLYEQDPSLTNPLHANLRAHMLTLFQNKPQWDKIA